MNIGSRIVYWILLWSCRIVGILPTWFLYHCILDVVYFLMYKVIRYRVGVVRDNLQRAFPEKSDEQRRDIERRFYYHLAEVVVDMIDVVSITRKQIAKRLVIENIEEHERSVDGHNWIAALAHYGSWEYFAAYPMHTEAKCASAYHPLHNKAIDRLMLYSRSRFGMNLVPMYDLLRFVVANKEKPEGNFALGMITDQAPPLNAAYTWMEFMGLLTGVYTGMEKMATRYGLQVYFFQMAKPSRTRYRGTFEMIYDGHEKVEPGEITRRYIRRLEEQIRQRPELWMWSHKRWKHAPPEDIVEKHRKSKLAGTNGEVTY